MKWREILLKRCAWVPENDEIYTKYHDEEWGVPVHDDRLLFEFLTLEGFQAGLSWITILRKRENFEAAFDNFDVQKVSCYDDKKIAELMNNAGIIRNRRKITAAVNNARAFIKVAEEYGSFDAYIWRFVNGNPLINHWQRDEDVPAKTELSDQLSEDLKKRGFKFVGSTICYSHMQATGMVNDHIVDCFRYKELSELC
jgi:DNA-3-methyladenine glycosylase I